MLIYSDSDRIVGANSFEMIEKRNLFFSDFNRLLANILNFPEY